MTSLAPLLAASSCHFLRIDIDALLSFDISVLNCCKCLRAVLYNAVCTGYVKCDILEASFVSFDEENNEPFSFVFLL